MYYCIINVSDFSYQGVLLFRHHTFFSQSTKRTHRGAMRESFVKKKRIRALEKEIYALTKFHGAGVATACRATVEGSKKLNCERCSATHRDARECRRGVKAVANEPSRLFPTLLQRAEETVAIRARRARIILDSQRRVSARSRCRREIVLARRVSRGGGA